MSAERKHILVLPYALFGHMTPLLQLARKISQYHDVTFVVSKLRVEQLRQRGIFTAEDEKAINLIAILDDLQESDDSEGTLGQMMAIMEKTMNFTSQLFQTMPATADTNGAVKDEYLSLLDKPLQRPIDVVIGDLVAFFQVNILVERGIPCFVFLSSSGFMLANKLDVNLDTPVIPDKAFFSDWEAHEDVSKTGIPKAYKETMEKHGTYFLEHFRNIAGYVVNSVAELEKTTVQKFKTHLITAGKPVRFVAPLFAEESVMREDAKAAGTLVGDWLDNQKDRSVIYVSFGSYAVSAKEQITEIAQALLSLDKPFIWSLKTNQHRFLPDEIRSEIPNQSKCSKSLVVSWSPQRRILTHKATRLFVSHVGYNSLLEAFDAGVPVVAWPMFGDQFANARMLERMGTGVALPGTGMLFARTVLAGEIAELVEKVGQWEKEFEQGDYAKKASDVSRIMKTAVAPGGSSEEAFLKFVQSDLYL